MNSVYVVKLHLLPRRCRTSSPSAVKLSVILHNMHILHAYMHGYYYIINIHNKAGETLGPENICKSAAWIRAVVSNVGGGPL